MIDGAVVEGGLDGYLYVLDAKTGKLLWKYRHRRRRSRGSTASRAQGGSIDAASITAADGLLFVNSGYGMFGGKAGNVFLAFKPKGKWRRRTKKAGDPMGRPPSIG